jgi:hypothetical protein
MVRYANEFAQEVETSAFIGEHRAIAERTVLEAQNSVKGFLQVAGRVEGEGLFGLGVLKEFVYRAFLYNAVLVSVADKGRVLTEKTKVSTVATVDYALRVGEEASDLFDALVEIRLKFHFASIVHRMLCGVSTGKSR